MTALRKSDSSQDILLYPRHPTLGKDPDPSAATPFAKRFPAFYKANDGNRASIMPFVQLSSL